MSDELFDKIVAELTEHQPQYLIPCFFNEPLLDKNLEERLALVKEKIPRIKINLITNASLLFPARARAFLNTKSRRPALLHRLSISFQGISKEKYERSMPGLSFKQTLENVEYVLRLAKERQLREPKITVSMVNTEITADEAEKAARFWQTRGAEFRLLPYEDRAGTVDSSGLASNLRPYHSCRRPFNTAVILFDGTVVLCCVDLTRKMVLGDLNRENLYQIWNSEAFQEIRKKFLSGRAEEIPLCSNCHIAE
jgi:radical SAM protein with 4Fe4S-binding SPASM domain